MRKILQRSTLVLLLFAVMSQPVWAAKKNKALKAQSTTQATALIVANEALGRKVIALQDKLTMQELELVTGAEPKVQKEYVIQGKDAGFKDIQALAYDNKSRVAIWDAASKYVRVFIWGELSSAMSVHPSGEKKVAALKFELEGLVLTVVFEDKSELEIPMH